MRSLAVVLLVLLVLPALMSGLQCYYCETAKNVSCPGWERYSLQSVQFSCSLYSLQKHSKGLIYPQIQLKLQDCKLLDFI